MKRKIKGSLRLFAVLVTVLLLVSLTGCYREIRPSDEEARAVGTVGGYTVCYDELYYLAMTTREMMESEYGEGIFDTEVSRDRYRAELCETVYENLMGNYAVLTLAAEAGYTEADVEALTTEYMQGLVDSLGGMHEYKKMLHENHMTDRFVRFTYRVSLLRSNTLHSYVYYLGLIESEAEAISEIVMDEEVYACTRHIAVFKDNGKSDEENRAVLEGLLSRIESGEADFDALVEEYSEDEGQTADGYYFMRGEMQEGYENAAFSLSLGETSDVVETADGYYIIRRLPKDHSYVLMNCYGSGAALYEGYQNYTFLQMLDEQEEMLSFIPNDYGKTIDLTALEEKPFFDLAYLMQVLGIVLLCLGVAALIAWWCVVSIRADRKEREQKKTKHQKR